MSLEPYLCIGGVEVAHPTRTLAYLANVGHGYLASPPDPACKECFGAGATPPPPPPPPGLAIITAALTPAVVNQAYSQQVLAANADGPLSWTATGLPPGLSIGLSSGFIIGTPTTVGTYNPTIFVSDGTPPIAQRTYTLIVGSEPPPPPPPGTAAVPYALTAGFERSVPGELGTMVWEMYRGAATVTKVGVRREVRVTNTSSRPSVIPTTGWVGSDYAASFTLPLLLQEDVAGNCATGSARFERWHLYDIEAFPVPHTSPPAPGEASGYVSLLFYIQPCGVADAFGQCAVSFDNGATWPNITTTTIPGRAGGSVLMPIQDVPTGPLSFRFSNTPTDATTFCHGFEYISGGSGHFDVEVWFAPSAAYDITPPPLPITAGEVSPWQLGGLGQLTSGVPTVNFERNACALWAANQGGYYKWWRYIDRITRASVDLVVALGGPNFQGIPTWNGYAAYSLNGGQTWHVPPMGNTALLVQPPLARPRVPTVVAAPGAPAPAGAIPPPSAAESAPTAEAAAALPAAADEMFTDPVTDNAPWYDPAIPESAEVLGVWIEEFKAPVPWKRDVRDKRWGGSLSPSRMPSRELLLSGFVYTKSCEATEYAKRWLFESLATEGCEACDLPDAIVYRGCDPATDSAQYARTIRRVGLVDFDPEIDSEFPCCLGFKFEATLRAEVPYMYRDPVPVYNGPIVDLGQEPICSICSPCPAISNTAAYTCGCMDVREARVDARSLNECYCSPARVRRLYVPIAPPGQLWNDATVRLTLTAGGPISGDVQEGLRNIRVVAYTNPMQVDAALAETSDVFDCQDPCVSVEVSCLPATAQLIVDGSSRRSTVKIGALEQNGWGYLSSGGGGRFEWPDIGCNGLMLCIETDSVHTSPGGSLLVELVPRERA